MGALGAWRLRGDTLPDGGHGAGCVQLEDRQLLARIYYNRGTSALAQREFGRAEGHLSLCLELDPRFQPARHNRIVAGNEAVVALCSERQFEQAAELLPICLALDPDNPTTLANDVHLHHGWVMQLCSQRRFLEALRLLEDCHARRPEVEFFDRGRRRRLSGLGR